MTFTPTQTELMQNMANIFAVGAQAADQNTTLANYLEKVPYIPQTVSEEVEFTPQPLLGTTSAVIEQLIQPIALQGPTLRGNGAQVNRYPKRNDRQVQTPYKKFTSFIEPLDILNIRAPGTLAALTSAVKVDYILRANRYNMMLWFEWLKVGALTGGPRYSTLDAKSPYQDVNLYTLLGEAQQTQEFTLASAGTYVFEDILPQLRDKVLKALGLTETDGIDLFVTEKFMTALMKNAQFRDSYLKFRPFVETKPITVEGGYGAKAFGRRLDLTEVMKMRIIEYVDPQGWGILPDSGTYGTGVAVPMGVPGLLVNYIAPVNLNTNSAVAPQGTVDGLEYVMNIWTEPNNEGMTVDIHSSTLPACTRPGSLPILYGNTALSP
jgi:hypothetical protein